MEAKWLFDVKLEQIQVVVHPQSVIHSMVEYEDGAVIAQLGTPDMRLPIALGLSAPDALALLALCVCMGLFIPVAGLAVNLWLPRLDCENDTIVVKQSASSMIGIFGGMLVVGLGALLWAVGGKLLGFVWFSLAAAAVLLAGAALGWHWLCGSGARILQKL